MCADPEYSQSQLRYNQIWQHVHHDPVELIARTPSLAQGLNAHDTIQSHQLSDAPDVSIRGALSHGQYEASQAIRSIAFHLPSQSAHLLEVDVRSLPETVDPLDYPVQRSDEGVDLG